MCPVAQAPARSMARITGAVYLLFFMVAALGEFFMNRAGISGIGAVSDDATATANKLLAHESSFRVGFAFALISIACYIALAVLFYQMFKRVSKSLALLATFFGLIGQAVQAFADFFLLAPLVLLGGGQYLSAFRAEQLRSLSLMFLNLNNQASHIGLVFDGLFLLLIGYLIFRSAFMPKILGTLVAFAGLGWLAFLSPALAKHLLSYIEVLGILAEASLMLWLLVIGVSNHRSKKEAGEAGIPAAANARRPRRAQGGGSIPQAGTGGMTVTTPEVHQ